MAIQLEIERKFLIKKEFPRDPDARTLRQGYIAREDGRSVRVRQSNADFTLTIKGPAVGVDLGRLELEMAITAKDGAALLDGFCPRLIEKTRHRLDAGGGLVWEVDEFFGENTGLMMAEIELPNPKTSFAVPDWIGREVTRDARFYNAALVDSPIAQWRAEFDEISKA